MDVRASGEPKPGGSWDKNLWPRGVQQCKKGMLVKGGSEVRDGVNLCIHTLPSLELKENLEFPRIV